MLEHWWEGGNVVQVTPGSSFQQGSFWQVALFDTLDSTNTRIKEAIAQDRPEGTCVVARQQTGGYGRQGRAWTSPEGGLYFSFILDPLHAHPSMSRTMADLPSLSLVMSLGVQTALARLVDGDIVKIKWPNDIVVVTSGMPAGSFAKLCGISLEAVQGKLCCGVGVNAFRPIGADQASPSHAAGHPYALAYLEDIASNDFDRADRDGALRDLLAIVLASVEWAYSQWLETGIEPLVLRYNGLLFNIGQQVMLDTIDGKLLYEGEVLGVNDTGQLLLKTAAGETVPVASGEVHTRTPSAH